MVSKRGHLAAFAALAGFWAFPTQATPLSQTVDSALTAETQAESREFPRSPLLQPNVAFWTRVFTDYSEYQSVIHSMDQADKVYRVLDFREDAERLGPIEA